MHGTQFCSLVMNRRLHFYFIEIFILCSTISTLRTFLNENKVKTNNNIDWFAYILKNITFIRCTGKFNISNILEEYAYVLFFTIFSYSFILNSRLILSFRIYICHLWIAPSSYHNASVGWLWKLPRNIFKLRKIPHCFYLKLKTYTVFLFIT